MILRQLDVAHIGHSSASGSGSLLLSLTAGCASLLLAAGILWVGTTLTFKTSSVGLRLLHFDSGNPRIEYRLGRLYEDTNPMEGITHLRRAAKLSRFNPHYLSHLASACESNGETRCADEAWQHLAMLCPSVPLYRWRAGESYLRTKQLDASLAQFRRLLDLDPEYAPQIWYALLGGQRPHDIFQELLANRTDSKIKVEYAKFLSDQGNDNDAYRVWRQLAATSDPVNFATVKPYLERLITLDRIDEAESVWLDLKRMGALSASEADKNGGLIFNGDFEQTPLNAGFDWRQSDQTTYLYVDFSAPGAYHGGRCLRVDFTVNRNEAYEPAYQIVPVLPNRAYKLEAYVRSEDITSDTGPYLRVSDTQQHRSENALSDTTVGTTSWHPVRLNFSTGPEAQTVRLSIWRPRGRTFPTEISGTFWVDSVSLHDMGRAVEQVASTSEQ